MQYEYLTTNDNVKLAYQTSIPLQPQSSSPSSSTAPNTSTTKPCLLLLLHGFSGSSAYFTRNTTTLSSTHWVLTPDMRGHGLSGRPQYGYHVARLAMDLHELIQLVKRYQHSTPIYAVGCSIGAAVLWTYVELFSDADFAGFVFVDQAPLQNRSEFGGGWGADKAHYGCYDEKTMLAAQSAWGSEDPGVREETYGVLVADCLGYRYRYQPSDADRVTEEQRREDGEFFVGISRTCDGVWLARLLGDHTGYDHREAIELITKPVLVMAGRRSGCFSVDGMMETVRRVEMGKKGRARGVVFDSGHWLFWEEPDRFNAELLGFVRECQS